MMQAEAVAEEFKQYAYRVSHDVSAPVRAMVEFSRLLTTEETGALSSDGKEYLSLIVENGQKLQAMMDGLLEYSRLNTQEAPFKAVDLTVVARAAIAQCQEQHAAPRAVWDVQQLPVLHADGEQMRKLFCVLVQNALTFQPAGQVPHITITSHRKEHDWEIQLIDNGIGIAPAYYEVVFQPFRRLHTDEEYPGVGMGLTLARKIIERHGGAIRLLPVASGTGVAFTLPIKEV